MLSPQVRAASVNDLPRTAARALSRGIAESPERLRL